MVKYAQLHFSTTRLSMLFMFMDIIGPFDPSSNGYQYALTVTCMLTGYTFLVSLKTKHSNQNGSTICR